MTIPAYPLQWPAGWRRTDAAARAEARFRNDGGRYSLSPTRRLTIADGIKRLRDQLRRMTGADDFVVSTNLQLRLDGLPRSGQAEPQDPGAAVYWRDAGGTRCMAIDR